MNTCVEPTWDSESERRRHNEQSAGPAWSQEEAWGCASILACVEQTWDSESERRRRNERERERQ